MCQIMELELLCYRMNLDDRPIAYTSCVLTDTECHYVQIEKEMLAFTYGL